MMCMDIEIASIIFEICIVPDYFWHGTTPGPCHRRLHFFSAVVWSVLVGQQGITR